MSMRCNPRNVNKTYKQAGSWRKAARVLNALYGVDLSHTTWHDYATGRNDIADPEIRSHLGLSARPCPSCGHKHIQRKQARQKRIRVYGYPMPTVRPFVDLLDRLEAMR